MDMMNQQESIEAGVGQVTGTTIPSPSPPLIESPESQNPRWIIGCLGKKIVEEDCHNDKQKEPQEINCRNKRSSSLYWKLRATIEPSCQRSHSLVQRVSEYQTPKTFNGNNINIITKKSQRANSSKSIKSAWQIRGNANIVNQDVDSGYAWVILAVMFLINASTFGTARAYGLIFEKLARSEEESRSLAALPFTVMGAVENMAGPITGYLLARTRSWRLTVFVGSCLITLSHLLAALFDSLLGQTLTMGLMCGLGLSFVTISSFQINNAYFVRYRSRAFGLGLTGAAFGTFYISPLCQYVLNNYSTNLCYLVLSLILLPNVPLSLLLRPIRPIELPPLEKKESNISAKVQTCEIISGRFEPAVPADKQQYHQEKEKLWRNVWLVLKSPVFHLIWPTQLLFCWFNFVFGMVIVDFGVDRGLGCDQILIPIWALGQLVGRLGLGSLVDMKFISFRLFTVICFAVISVATWSLNKINSGYEYEQLWLAILVFILSMFISNLYILFNDLVEFHMDKSLTSLSIGIASFTGSFFLLPRASVIGHYRDTIGNYDDMFTMFSYISMAAAVTWLIAPGLCHRAKLIWLKFRYRHNHHNDHLHLPPPPLPPPMSDVT